MEEKLQPTKIGIITLANLTRDEKSAHAVASYFDIKINNPLTFEYVAVENTLEAIKKTIVELIEEKGCNIVTTIGGVGPAPTDFIVQATEEVADKLLPGFGEQMRTVFFKTFPIGIISRQTAAVKDKALIINLPDRAKVIHECLEVVFPAVPYCLDLLKGVYIVSEDRRVFRP
jgi:molybdopterin adenylyltransferase